MTDQTSAALTPLCTALEARAVAAAEALRVTGERDRADRLAAARQEASEVLTAARRRGEHDGAALVAGEHAAARSSARTVVLSARAAAHEDLRTRAAVAVADLLSDPAAQARLAQVILAGLGTDAVVQPAPGGGLIAVAPDGRRVDGSVGALVTAALAEIDLEALWTP